MSAALGGGGGAALNFVERADEDIDTECELLVLGLKSGVLGSELKVEIKRSGGAREKS
mgnify:CR=1 FL=1